MWFQLKDGAGLRPSDLRTVQQTPLMTVSSWSLAGWSFVSIWSKLLSHTWMKVKSFDLSSLGRTVIRNPDETLTLVTRPKHTHLLSLDSGPFHMEIWPVLMNFICIFISFSYNCWKMIIHLSFNQKNVEKWRNNSVFLKIFIKVNITNLYVLYKVEQNQV